MFGRVYFASGTYQRANRTDFFWFEFGSVRLFFLKAGSSSVRFDFIFEKPVRVRFGSIEFSKNRFEFGSDRHKPNRTVSVRFGSVRYGWFSLSGMYNGIFMFCTSRFIYLCILRLDKSVHGSL